MIHVLRGLMESAQRRRCSICLMRMEAMARRHPDSITLASLPSYSQSNMNLFCGLVKRVVWVTCVYDVKHGVIAVLAIHFARTLMVLLTFAIGDHLILVALH